MQYAGLDVHKEFVQVCIIDEKEEMKREYKFQANSSGLKELAFLLKGKLSVMEASTSCYKVYDSLTENGCKVKIAHPLRVKAIASSKIKTDKIDASTLAKLLKSDFIPEARVPMKETRESYELIKLHKSLVESSVQIKNRIKAIIEKNAIEIPLKNVFTKAAREILLKRSSISAKFLIETELKQLDLLKEQLKEVDEKIEELANTNENALLLQTIPGVGIFSSLAIAAVIEDVSRFPSPEHLVSYCGLNPSIRQSGSTTHYGKISKQGNSLLRWILVQDAWIAIKHSKYFKERFDKLSAKKGKRKAIVAIARKLVTIIYFILVRKQPFNERLLYGKKERQEDASGCLQSLDSALLD